MTTAGDILRDHGVHPPSDAPGRYYTTCPKCSAGRSKVHQNNKVLGITIDSKGVRWGCNHCRWTDGAYFNGKANGHAEDDAIIPTYDYVDEANTLLFQVCRKAGKKFLQRRPDGKGGWIWGTKDVRKVLYRLPELIEAIAAGHTMLVVEGEKDADAAWKIGLPATCNPGGASEPGKKSKWRREYSETLRGADVVILPDHDAAGYAHSESIARILLGVAKRVRILKLAEHWPEVAAKKGGDLSDGLTAHTREELDALIEGAPDYVAAEQTHTKRNPETAAAGEDAVALRFAEKHAETFRYVAAWNEWRKWTGSRWQTEDTLEAFDKARSLCRETGDARARTVAAVATLARADRRIAAPTDGWDADPEVFNAPVTIDLDTGISRAPRREDYCTKIAAVAPATPGTPRPLWDAFLDRVTAGDAELVGFIQRFLGYCLTGHTHEHVFMFIYGTGANGKGVFVNTVTQILGDYAVIAPMEMFLTSRFDRHPTEIARLKGARLVVAQETQRGRSWDEAKIKTLTSSDTLTGRFMRGNFFDFTPSHKLIITGNYKPTVRNADEAMRRRLLLVPFTVQIPPAERDPKLAEKLKAEWPAILRWMAEGYMEWQRGGLRVPESVRKATDQYLSDQDALARWIEEWVATDSRPDDFTSTGMLFASWKLWCEERNLPAGTETAFAESLSERGYVRDRKKKYGRGFNGIALKPSNAPDQQ